MSPHGNPEVPAGAAADVIRGARQVPAGSRTPEPADPAPTGPAPVQAPGSPAAAPEPAAWDLWEVFVRSNRGLSHVHAGSLHAPDADMALRNARDLYTRRNEGVSIWVVPAEAITTSDPGTKGAFFESPQGKDYRHATYYTKSEGVKHL
ncbi:phenylacetate-CoA oxygenase [Arthrobacter sp. RIT-PI-e]|uniref:1,2-phenylacetyl-CoA epoxidase subunit PaaB n=1 Tax=Arthrobacter sp. RIT-PI-e TaxID=1681197 RepID=UPI0006767B88|nr:1,2-phenylacetyl-CoA epoxidase subunit PaaB [Arthrobacter sp. RIT-PI-e]KNC17857.1 phenylacetate-CoA oxygenase [Arthrobacter sp. RIT-PI-e]